MAPPVAAQPVLAAPADALAGERRLALLRPDGSRPVDAMILALEDRVRKNPESLDPWILLGQAWVRKARESAEPGYYRSAEACAAVGLALVPDSPLALNLRGLVLLNDHQFEAARQLAQTILKHHEFDPTAWGTLGDALLELGRLDEAEDAVQQMMRLKPNLPSYARASYLHFLRGHAPAAKQSIRLAIDAAAVSSRDPEPRAWALVQAANLFFLEGDYEGADAGYELALKGFPDYPAALVGRGQVLVTAGRYREAAGHFATAYRLNPLTETAWLLGDARALAGDGPGAAEAYRDLMQKGRRTDPRTVALYLATEGRDLDEALRLIEAERSGRSDLYTQDVYAYVLMRKGRAAEARRLIDAVLAVGIKDPRILGHAASIHAADGDRVGARALAEEALRRSPRFDVHGAKAAAELLASLPAVPATVASR